MSNKIAVLVSGGGRSLENLAQLQERGELNAEVALVLSDRSGAFAIERASRLGIRSKTIDPEGALAPEEFSSLAFAAIEESGSELVVLAGFLRFLPIPDSWAGRVINIHPSLLPAFGGKGYYGDRVHAAALKRGVKFSGCTVHFVTPKLDSGKIIMQKKVSIYKTDNPRKLGKRI